MKGRRRKLWILLGCAVTAAALTLWLTREPSYAGRSLSEWVWILQNGTSHTNAEAAIQHIGADAVPLLVKWIDYRERPWRRHLCLLSYKLPPKLANPLSTFIAGRGYERQQGAYIALTILGPKAKAAVPALRRQIQKSTPYYRVFNARKAFLVSSNGTLIGTNGVQLILQPSNAYMPLNILAAIGEAGVPPILEVLRDPANPNRAAAVNAVAQLDPALISTENVTSALISCLDDNDSILALRAGGILCSHKFDQEVVMRIFTATLQANNKHVRRDEVSPIRICVMKSFSLPNLIGLLQDTNSPYSADAAAVLADFAGDPNPQAALLAPLTASLLDPRPSVRKFAAAGLGNFGDAAEPSVPALLDTWADPDDHVRQNATNALFQIPAYALFKDVAALDNITTEPARSKWIQQYLTDTPAAQSAQLFQHRDPRIREMATNAFHRLKDSLDADATAAAPTQPPPPN